MANNAQVGVRSDRQTGGRTNRQMGKRSYGRLQTNKIIDKGWQATTQISRAGLGSRKNNMEAGKQTKRQSFKKIDK